MSLRIHSTLATPGKSRRVYHGRLTIARHRSLRPRRTCLHGIGISEELGSDGSKTYHMIDKFRRQCRPPATGPTTLPRLSGTSPCLNLSPGFEVISTTIIQRSMTCTVRPLSDRRHRRCLRRWFRRIPRIPMSANVTRRPPLHLTSRRHRVFVLVFRRRERGITGVLEIPRFGRRRA